MAAFFAMQHRLRLISANFVILFTLFATAHVSAEDAIMPPPSAPLSTPAERETIQRHGGPQHSRPTTLSDPFFTAGPISFHPSITYRYLETDGLPIGLQRASSSIQTVSPDLRFDLGREWTLNYSPTWTYYSEPTLKDTVDQSAGLHGSVIIQDWILQVSESYSISSPTLVETAQQTKQKNWLTSVSAAHSFGSKIGLQLNASLAENYTDQYPDTRNWSTQDWLTVQFSPTMDIGVGPGAGYIEILGAPDMTFERYMARFNWRVTRKISLGVNGGMEYRHSRASTGSDLKYPTMNATLNYQPFDATRVTFSYARELSGAYFRNQVNKGSSWNVGFEQRLLTHLFFSANWSHNRSKYEDLTLEITPPLPIDSETGTTDSGTGPILISLPGRRDRTDSLSSRLTFQFLKRLSLAATYQRSKNSSNLGSFSFHSTQYGIELSCSY